MKKGGRLSDFLFHIFNKYKNYSLKKNTTFLLESPRFLLALFWYISLFDHLSQDGGSIIYI